MAPLARRLCLYMEGGCTWKTPLCDQITIVSEAEQYLMGHSSECVFNPAVVEERQHKRRQEEAEVACPVAETEAEVARHVAAEERREAAKANERREF